MSYESADRINLEALREKVFEETEGGEKDFLCQLKKLCTKEKAEEMIERALRYGNDYYTITPSKKAFPNLVLKNCEKLVKENIEKELLEILPPGSYIKYDFSEKRFVMTVYFSPSPCCILF